MRPIWNREENIVWVESIDSTQTEMCRVVKSGSTSVTVLGSLEQTCGRGRFGRDWYSPAGKCLAASFALFEYADWERPELLGMAIGLAAAQSLDLEIAWPNDLVLNGKKIGGIIADLPKNPIDQLVPVIGIGINLGITEFPSEIKETASSLVLEGRKSLRPEDALDLILDAISDIPEPRSFQSLQTLWSVHDVSIGKMYKLPNGELGKAVEVASNGFLTVEVNGLIQTFPSAEAWFGN